MSPPVPRQCEQGHTLKRGSNFGAFRSGLQQAQRTRASPCSRATHGQWAGSRRSMPSCQVPFPAAPSGCMWLIFHVSRGLHKVLRTLLDLTW